jgi:hypothetical protein
MLLQWRLFLQAIVIGTRLDKITKKSQRINFDVEPNNAKAEKSNSWKNEINQ